MKIKKYPSQNINLKEFHNSDWFKAMSEDWQEVWKSYPPNEMFYHQIGENQYVSCVVIDVLESYMHEEGVLLKIFKRGENPPDTIGEFKVPEFEVFYEEQLPKDAELLDVVFE